MKKVHVLLASIAIIAIIATINAEAQDPGSLDRRISLLEQRFFRLESSMTRLEQVVVSLRSTPAPSGRDQDVLLMRQELEGLKLRLNEIECGLVKLDERTTPANARKDGDDQCRLNSNSRVRLSTRP
jgi:hypothetical protein